MTDTDTTPTATLSATRSTDLGWREREHLDLDERLTTALAGDLPSASRVVLTAASAALRRGLLTRATIHQLQDLLDHEGTPTMPDTPTVYILVNPSWIGGAPDSLEYVRGTMESYEPDVYSPAIAQDGLDAVTDQEWADGWTPENAGDNAYATRADADAACEDNQIVIEVTRDDVRRALEIEFGPDTDD